MLWIDKALYGSAITLISLMVMGFRCHNDLITVGDTKNEVLRKCKSPLARESSYERWTTFRDDGSERSKKIPLEEWLYNPGPDQFMTILHFRYDELVKIESKGRGISRFSTRKVPCGKRIVSLDDTKAEVALKCGPPTHKDQWEETLVTPVSEVQKKEIPISYEQWNYDYGSVYLPRELTFKNNRLVGVRSGAGERRK